MQASSASIGCAFWVLTKKTYGYNWYDWRRWKGLGISYRNLKKIPIRENNLPKKKNL